MIICQILYISFYLKFYFIIRLVTREDAFFSSFFICCFSKRERGKCFFFFYVSLWLTYSVPLLPHPSGHFECIPQRAKLCNVFTFQCKLDVELIVVVFCFIFFQQLDEENEGRSLCCFLVVDGMDQFAAAKLLLCDLLLLSLTFCKDLR